MLVVTILDVQLCQTDGADNASGAVPFFWRNDWIDAPAYADSIDRILLFEFTLEVYSLVEAGAGVVTDA